MSTCFAEQVLCLVPKEEKTCKELFNLENAKKRELEVINLIRKKEQADILELDENLCNHAMKFAEETAKTGSRSTAKEINGAKHSVNSIVLNLRRGCVYKGGEGVKKMYNDYKNNANNFSVIMGKALINKTYKKLGFGYYFLDNNKLYVFAVFDSF